MERFYEVEIHPKDDACPDIDRMHKSVNCIGCEFCKYIGTHFGGKFRVICTYDENGVD